MVERGGFSVTAKPRKGTEQPPEDLRAITCMRSSTKAALLALLAAGTVVGAYALSHDKEDTEQSDAASEATPPPINPDQDAKSLDTNLGSLKRFIVQLTINGQTTPAVMINSDTIVTAATLGKTGGILENISSENGNSRPNKTEMTTDEKKFPGLMIIHLGEPLPGFTKNDFLPLGNPPQSETPVVLQNSTSGNTSAGKVLSTKDSAFTVDLSGDAAEIGEPVYRERELIGIVIGIDGNQARVASVHGVGEFLNGGAIAGNDTKDLELEPFSIKKHGEPIIIANPHSDLKLPSIEPPKKPNPSTAPKASHHPKQKALQPTPPPRHLAHAHSKPHHSRPHSKPQLKSQPSPTAVQSEVSQGLTAALNSGQNKIEIKMSGAGKDFVLPSGSGSLGPRGNGGTGTGFGRIHGMGTIDTGGGTGLAPGSLGKRHR